MTKNLATPITSKGWTLHYTIGDVVCGPVGEGDVVEGRDGPYTVISGTPPHKVNSTGRVYVDTGAHRCEFYPSVIGAKWVQS